MAFLDVTAYSAKGDGQTDDTAAIQSCLDAASPGDDVYFPAGSYVIGATHAHIAIPAKPLTIIGDGPEATKLLGAFPGDGNASGASVFMGAASGLRVEHLSIRRKDGAGFQCGMRALTGSSGLVFRDVAIIGAGMGSQLTTIVAGVWVAGGVTGFAFEDGSVSDLGQTTNESAFIIISTGASQSQDVVVARSTFAGRISEKPSAGIIVFDTKRATIHGNTISDVGHATVSPNASGYGICVYQMTVGLSADATITGNTIDRTDGSGIYVPGCRGALVSRNTVRDVALVQDNGTLCVGGIAVSGSGKIERNNIDRVGGGGQPNPPCGIVAQAVFGGQLDIDNNMVGHAYAGLQLREPHALVRHAGRGNVYGACQTEVWDA